VRVAILSTWLLLISLKFAIASRLPKIPDRTYLDCYLLLSYGAMSCLVLYSCLQKYLGPYLQARMSCVVLDPSGASGRDGSESIFDVDTNAWDSSAESGEEAILLSNSSGPDITKPCILNYSHPMEAIWLWGLSLIDNLSDAYVMLFSACVWTAWHVAARSLYKFDISSNEMWSEYHRMKRELAELNAKKLVKKKLMQQVLMTTVRSPSLQSRVSTDIITGRSMDDNAEDDEANIMDQVY
jgi:hypothetical protein